MFALSLVVIAGLIGGRGLGDVVTNGLYSNAALAHPRRRRDRDHGDRARPRHRGDRRAHRPDAPPPHRRGRKRRDAHAHAPRRSPPSSRSSSSLARSASDSIYPDEFETATTSTRRRSRGPAALDPVRARLRAGPDLVHLRDHRADRQLPRRVRPRAAARVPRRDAVVRHARRAHGDRVRAERPAPGDHGAADARARSASWASGTRRWTPPRRCSSPPRSPSLLGIAIGVWAAESPRVERLLRPLLDTLQTLPQLVYIIPFIYLMPVSRVPGVVASVLYAIPVVIRLVTNGVRDVPPAAVEAAYAVRRVAHAGAGEGEDPARPRQRSCSASTRGSSWSSPWS